MKNGKTTRNFTIKSMQTKLKNRLGKKSLFQNLHSYFYIFDVIKRRDYWEIKNKQIVKHNQEEAKGIHLYSKTHNHISDMVWYYINPTSVP